jgi:hypothetical protein
MLRGVLFTLAKDQFNPVGSGALLGQREQDSTVSWCVAQDSGTAVKRKMPGQRIEENQFLLTRARCAGSDVGT